MTGRLRLAVLPATAVVLVASVLGIQLAYGGGTFEPLRPADPCVVRTVTSRASGIDALSERLVLLGLDGAACRLHLSREAFTLELAGAGPRSDAEIDAFREGLRSAVRTMKADGTLPKASGLVGEALDSMDLNPLVKAAILALPDSAVNAALKTDDVLLRMVDDLDLRRLLADLGDQDDLQQQVEVAVVKAVKDSLAARLRGLV